MAWFMPKNLFSVDKKAGGFIHRLGYWETVMLWRASPT